jgi:hypothetical protein
MHHPEVVAQRCHMLILAVSPAVDALRSQTSLNAMLTLQAGLIYATPHS